MRHMKAMHIPRKTIMGGEKMNNMRELRKKKKLTMKQLGQMVGVSESTISLYENGKHEPDIMTMILIADALETTVDNLLGKEPEKKRDEDQRIPKTVEARIVSFAMDQLPQEDREKLLAVVRAMYSNKPELFEKKGDNEHDT